MGSPYHCVILNPREVPRIHGDQPEKRFILVYNPTIQHKVQRVETVFISNNSQMGAGNAEMVEN